MALGAPPLRCAVRNTRRHATCTTHRPVPTHGRTTGRFDSPIRVQKYSGEQTTNVAAVLPGKCATARGGLGWAWVGSAAGTPAAARPLPSAYRLTPFPSRAPPRSLSSEDEDEDGAHIDVEFATALSKITNKDPEIYKVRLPSARPTPLSLTVARKRRACSRQGEHCGSRSHQLLAT